MYKGIKSLSLTHIQSVLLECSATGFEMSYTRVRGRGGHQILFWNPCIVHRVQANLGNARIWKFFFYDYHCCTIWQERTCMTNLEAGLDSTTGLGGLCSNNLWTLRSILVMWLKYINTRSVLKLWGWKFQNCARYESSGGNTPADKRTCMTNQGFGLYWRTSFQNRSILFYFAISVWFLVYTARERC